jgi:osmotically-inducible protein OsmY
MSNDDRRFDPSLRPDYGRGARYHSGTDRDRYRTGREQRFWPERGRQQIGRGGAYEGDRRYGQGGYREETGYREYDDLEWTNEEPGEQYFGTGSHYGGGFGTAPSSRASSAGTSGAPGYAHEGAWSDPADWTPEDSSNVESISYRGRGPKGYLRSDERLRETICEGLTDDPRIDASDIEVEVKDQAVTLRGSVDDRRTKYAVEELVAGCGVRDIENQLRVTRKPW